MQKEELKFYYNSTPCLLFCQWLFRAHFSLIAGIFVTLFWPSLPIFAQIKSWGKSIAMRSFEFVIICCTGIIRITLYTIWSPPLPLTQIIQCHFLGGFFWGGGGGGYLPDFQNKDAKELNISPTMLLIVINYIWKKKGFHVLLKCDFTFVVALWDVIKPYFKKMKAKKNPKSYLNPWRPRWVTVSYRIIIYSHKKNTTRSTSITT